MYSGLGGKIIQSLYKTYVGVSMSLISRLRPGTNVFERDWDLLILLDTCRVDAMNAVADDYDFIKDVNSIWSVGSTSSEWIANTFVSDYREEICKTAYISGNAHAELVLKSGQTPNEDKDAYFSFADWDTLSDNSLALLDNVWKYAPNEGHGHVRPKYITDRAIQVGRQEDVDRVIVHYSQPHHPYATRANRENREMYDYEATPFEFLRQGGDHDVVWESYISELQTVLDEVEVLLNNFDAESVAISADHGECFGEWGVYSHPAGVLHPDLRRVPWVRTKGIDGGTYNSTLKSTDYQSQSVEDQLEALGYK
ncbi:hypothetical protein [Halobaculum roseum]|uniref:Sulfatase n=1 Tax=Halobaculum roseum TaxID=2175149 RepID=A0ABD5MN38_9EURY|nr:hypothetical protein [Halobaculum roseum]QZY03244.1 hypothetical protein K6T36_03435 [Halobaculum roseum]